MKQKKKSDVAVLLDYAGSHKGLTFLGLALSAVSMLLSMAPYICIWLVARDLIAVAPDWTRAQDIAQYGFHHPEAHVVESGPVAFCGWLDHRYARPYRTEVQLYKSLLALKRSIDRDCIVTSQREALQMLRCVISNLEYRFYKAYNMEFEDKRTVYSECAFRLIPREDEPSVCLMHDWVYLPTA